MSNMEIEGGGLTTSGVVLLIVAMTSMLGFWTTLFVLSPVGMLRAAAGLVALAFLALLLAFLYACALDLRNWIRARRARPALTARVKELEADLWQVKNERDTLECVLALKTYDFEEDESC